MRGDVIRTAARSLSIAGLEPLAEWHGLRREPVVQGCITWPSRCGTKNSGLASSRISL
jgi:hypothetical protein